jgi:uncharacterized membrane protein (DUF106 family)
VGVFNAALTGLFEGLFWPFRGLHPLWALLAISVVTGILMLWLFGKVSDQDRIRVVRDRIRGNLIGIRLFGDDLGLLFRLQGRILRQTATYLRHAFVPMLVMIVPVIFILIQLNLHFSVRPLAPEERAVVKVRLADAETMKQGVSLEAPEGVTVETRPVRAAMVREVAWRIRADAPGRHRLVVRAGGETVEKELVVGSGWGATSARRAAGLWDVLTWPGEPPIRSGPVESIDVTYPELDLRFLGFGINWLVFFFIASIVAGFAFKGVLGIEI